MSEEAAQFISANAIALSKRTLRLTCFQAASDAVNGFYVVDYTFDVWLVEDGLTSGHKDCQ